MEILKKLDALLVRIIQPILIIVGLTVALMLVVGIFMRSVIQAPVFGLEEIMLLAVMWFYMLGAALASRERSHLAADFVQVISKNPRVLRAAHLFSTLISLVMAVFICTWTWDLLSFGLEKGQSTPVFVIPWWVSQASLFVASVLFVIYLLRDVYQAITGEPVHPGDSSAEVE